MQGGDRGPRWFDVLWRVLRPVAIFLAACLLVVGALSTAVVYCYENFVMPVDENDQTLVPITIERGSSISSIARQLKEADLIRNKGVFQYLADFMGKSGKLKAGDYELSRSMTLTEIMERDGHESVLAVSHGGSSRQFMRCWEKNQKAELKGRVGNCCILKPSAYAPATSAVIRELIEAVFPPEYVAVVEGGRAENTALLEQRFDYIFSRAESQWESWSWRRLPGI